MAALPSQALSAMALIRLKDADLSQVLDRMVHIARDTLPAADEVSTTLVRGGKPFTAAYTDQLALDADELQYDRGYGPCIDAGESGTVLNVPDMRTETRWPEYSPRVIEAGVLSSLSVPLPVQTEVVGALNCYSRKVESFGPEEIELAEALAEHVAVAVANAMHFGELARETIGMQAAMETRAVIEQAKGIIMYQSRCSADEAFNILRKSSQGRNVKLRALAEGIVAKASGQ